MANTIITKNSSTASSVPTSGDLVQGELAVNVTDKRLFTENAGGTVVEVGTNPSSLTLPNGTANGVAYLNGSKVVTSGSDLTFDGGSLNVGVTSTPGVIVDRTNNASNAVIQLKTTAGSMYIGNANGTSFVIDDDNDLTTGPLFRVNNDGSSTIAASSTSDALRITQTGTGNALVVEDSTSPDSTPFVIDASGRVIKGYTTSVPSLGVTNTPDISAFGGSASNNGFGNYSYTASASASFFNFAKSRSTLPGTPSIVLENDDLGYIKFNGDDGTQFIEAARIWAEVDGTPGTNDMPGRLVFSTTADGASSPTERVRIDSSGNVGIGASSPSSLLHIARNDITAYDGAATDGQLSAGSTLFLQQTGGSNTAIAQLVFQPRIGLPYNRIVSSGGSAPYLTFVTNNAERLRIDSSGNVGIGTSSPSQKLSVAGDIELAQYLRQDSKIVVGRDSGASFVRLGSGEAGDYLRFFSGGAERMRVDSSGNLLVGTTSGTTNTFLKGSSGVPTLIVRNNQNSGTLFGINANFSGAAPNDATSFFLQCNDTGAERATIRSNGGLANYQGNNVNLSDRREKKDFAPAGSYLDKICAIPVQTFNYIDQSEDDPGLTLGVVAQDVQAVAPELVMESDWSAEKDGSKMRLSIYQTDLQYALMKCIQEQQAIIESLKARLDAANL